MLQFCAAALVALAVSVAVAGVASRNVAETESVSDARLVTQVLARSILEPNLDDGLLTGDPAAIARLDELVIGKITGDRVLRVKLWTPEGGVVYSDDHRLLGQVFPLGPSERAALTSGAVDAEVSDLGKPENALDLQVGKLLEVYMAVHTPSGQPLLFETYSQYETVTDHAVQIFWPIVLVAIGALLLLEFVQMPLAWRTARRLGQAQEERELLLQKAIASSRMERRRIAADLHDRVVQELAAVSFNLAGAGARARTDPTRSAEVLHAGSAAVRGAIRSVRSLLVDIYPPSLHRTGLAAALQDLTSPLTSRGMTVEIDLADDLVLAEQDAELVYRIAQEALRNIINHAAATAVEVRVSSGDAMLILTVDDDGRGFDVAATDAAARPGHFGLSLLRDLATDAGASLTLTSEPGRGAHVRLELPQ
jgi:two-component system NarL family sensor kinase